MGHGIEIVPIAAIFKPCRIGAARAVEVIPVAIDELPTDGHAPGSGGLEPIQLPAKIDHALVHRIRALLEVIPAAVIRVPAAHKHARVIRAIPGIVIEFPSIRERARLRKVVAHAVNLNNAHSHNAGLGIEPIPRAPIFEPAHIQVALRVTVQPVVRFVLDPAIPGLISRSQGVTFIDSLVGI